MEHDVTERLSPVAALALCSCGWTYSTTRRQNALARTAKIRAAVKAHLAKVAGANPDGR